ncbi:hypothetical protein QQF64_027030 [Cirrhinus molitorella]|uniref:Uncharacterized protein n=1 Tax=Cirrhinus molitorella TaxID=172907 RepID=A0ABR3NBJ3_9TELE
MASDLSLFALPVRSALMGGICRCTCGWADYWSRNHLTDTISLSLTSVAYDSSDVSGFPEACSESGTETQSSSTHQPDTESGDTNETDFQKETKKLDPRARVTFSSVGRKIGQRHIQLLDEND